MKKMTKKNPRMQKCLREQKIKGKNRMESKNICRIKLGYKQKKTLEEN